MGANSEPIPARQSNDSRAKWVGKTGFLRSSGATAFVEWSSAVYNKTSEIGVSDAPTGRSDLRRVNPRNELSPARTLAGMRRLIDSDRSPAFSLLVSHPCSYTRGRSVGAFSSVRRAGRLHIANGHAGNRVSDIHEGLLGCRGTDFTAFSTRVQARRVMSLQPPAATFSDPERVRSRTIRSGKCLVASGFSTPGHVLSTRCCGSPRRGIATRPVWTAPAGPSPMGAPWAATGTHGFLATRRNPPWVPGKGDVMNHRPCLVAWSVRNPPPASVSIHRLNRSST